MKKSIGVWLVFLAILSLAVSGCTNLQSSKRSGAEMVVAELPDFQKQLYYANISSGSSFNASGLIHDPFVYDEYPASQLMNKNETEKSFVHQIIYQTTYGDFCLVFLKDESPPVIIKKIYLKKDGGLIVPSLEK